MTSSENDTIAARDMRAMQMIFIHGAPATGKLTIARELATITGARLFDNHIAIDLALSVFDFGEPEFWDLVVQVRLTTYREAARAGVPLLITTTAYNHPDDLLDFEAYEAAIDEHGGKILPVHLSCSEAELMRRVGDPSRVDRKKLTTTEGLKACLGRKTFSSVPRQECLSLDTESISALQSAHAITTYFGLPALSRA